MVQDLEALRNLVPRATVLIVGAEWFVRKSVEPKYACKTGHRRRVLTHRLRARGPTTNSPDRQIGYLMQHTGTDFTMFDYEGSRSEFLKLLAQFGEEPAFIARAKAPQLALESL